MSKSRSSEHRPQKDDLDAMGGTPIMALAILCMRVDKILAKMVRRILQ
jgi:selenophosphate synthase